MAEDMTDLGARTEQLALRLAGIVAEEAPTESAADTARQEAELANLYIKKDALTEQLEKARSLRSNKVIAGFVSLGAGVIGGGFGGGFSWYRANNQHADYGGAPTPEEAGSLHEAVVLWDGLTLSGLGVAGAGLLSGSILLLSGPDTAETEEELLKIEEQIENLEGGQ